MSVHEIKHPLVRHKLGLMRRDDVSTKAFRELASEVARLLTYEATKALATERANDILGEFVAVIELEQQAVGQVLRGEITDRFENEV